MKDEEKKILLELYEEHKKARALVARLEDVKTKEPKNIEGILNEIVALYEKHIEKENRKFFPFVFSYFTKEEKKQMCDEFILIDRKVLNEKYFQIASNIEKKLKNKI